MINFSSSNLSNKVFRSFEDLFTEIDPTSIVLVLDSNIVIFLRQFYLNPIHFEEKYGKTSPPVMLVRYFIEQISRYNLEVIATLGVDESSRSKSDFSILRSKQMQTHNALMSVLHLDIVEIDTFIKTKEPEREIIDSGECPDSMVSFLKKDTIYKHALIVTYLCSLKIIALYYDVINQELDNKTACLNFYKFIREEVDCVPGIVQSFALHLFGGYGHLKKIIFPKSSININKKLRYILGGSIDLLLPTFANKVVQQFYPVELSRSLITVFTSTDERISLLHSLSTEKLRLDSGEKINYMPSLVQTEILSGVKWSNCDIEEFNNFTSSDINQRLQKATSGPKKTDSLLGLVSELETLIKVKLK